MKMHYSHRIEPSLSVRRRGRAAGLLAAATAVLAVACTELSTAPRSDGMAQHGEVLFNAGSYEAAQAEADRTFDGRILVYFRSPDGPTTEAVERHLFANPEHARLLNDTFARYAPQVDSEESLAIMERYNVTSRTKSPLLMLVSERAILMTTIGDVNSPGAAAKKMAQVRWAVARDLGLRAQR